MNESAAAGLSDVQKKDLALIWDVHSIGITSSNNGSSTSINMRSSTSTSSSKSPISIALDDQTYSFIASLMSFLIHVLNNVADETIDNYINTPDDEDDDDDGNNHDNDANGNDNANHENGTKKKLKRNHQRNKFNSTLDTIQSFFPQLNDGGGFNFQSVATGGGVQQGHQQQQQLQTFKSYITTPRISNGRHILSLDHGSFLNESQSHNQTLREFGAFVYHRPQFGICAINCAIALTLITLSRRSSPMTLQSNGQNHNNNHNDNNNHNNNHNSSNIRNGSTSINPRSIIIHTRLYNVYPTIPIEHVKTSNAYKCITLKGRIVKVQSKRLRLFTANVLCIKCGQEFEHLFHDGRYELPTQCRGGQPCRGQKFELLRDTAKYIDYQKLKLQEDDNDIGSGGSGGGGGGSNNNSTSTSSSSAAGRTPRYIDLEVTDDLVDTCHAGDCVKVVGIIHALNTAVAKGKANRKAVSETSTYTLYMVANSIINTTADLHGNSNSNTHIGKQSSRGGLMFTKDQLEKITKVAHADHMMGPLSARMAFPFDLLVRSLCPGIIGHDCVKAGLLLALLGGTPPSSSGLEDVKSGLTIRSNIHCLIVGDPGMGKSCMLLASQQVAARSVYVGGNTSSTTGLTVSLSKEAGGEVGIEAGALVLADQGVCCIDEFDKMGKSNQDGLLEAMEQQRISIAKAGAIASLPSRCAVIAAANPRQGKYNLNKTVAENLNIAPPLLSRFDLVFILRDDADIDHDKLVSGNIMNIYRQDGNIHDESHGSARKRQKTMETMPSNQFKIKQRLPWVAQTQNPLPADLLKDYITYAREYCKPKLTQEAAAVLKNYFLTLRYPDNGCSRNDSVPITTRQLEALIRLSQARAKCCLREFVLKEDAEDVVELMRESVNQVHMDSDGRLDKTRGGVVGKSKRKQKKAFIDTLRQQRQNSFSKDDFYRVAAQLDLPLNDFWTIVEELRYSDQPELRKGPDGMYYLL